MRCGRVERMLSDHLDGALDRETAAAVEGHLRECPSCASARDRLARTRDLLGAANARDPGEEYWVGFWPRLEARLGRGEEPAPSLGSRVWAVLFPGGFDRAMSPAPVLAILALVCFNILLLTQSRRAAVPEAARPPAAAHDVVALPGRGGNIEVAAAGRCGIDNVLCDNGGRGGIDEYVLQPAAFRGTGPGRRKTDYIISRAFAPSLRAAPRGAY